MNIHLWIQPSIVRVLFRFVLLFELQLLLHNLQDNVYPCIPNTMDLIYSMQIRGQSSYKDRSTNFGNIEQFHWVNSSRSKQLIKKLWDELNLKGKFITGRSPTWESLQGYRGEIVSNTAIGILPLLHKGI